MIGYRIKKIAGYKTLLLGAVWLPVSCLAGSDQLPFTVKVRIETKTCDVNNNQPIDVEFGDMIIKNIDGSDYEQPVPYQLTCADSANGTKMKLRFEGGSGAALFNSDLLKTSENDLGLQFKYNNTKFAYNSWVPFTSGNQPTLTVVPVPSGDGGINDGELTATALLSVEYE